MENNQLVSVIIPTYRRTDMLPRAVNSVLNQTYAYLEVIVVDDNNPDTEYRYSTENVMQQYKDDQRVVYIQHENNKNGAAARNTGIKVSRGDYISFLDDDDWYLREKIGKQVSFLRKNKEYNAVYCGRFQRGRKIDGILHGDLSKHILSLTFTPTTTALMFRRSALMGLGGFNEKFKRHQDFELLLRYFRANHIGVIPEPLVVIGQNDGENEIHGEQLEVTKKMFLGMFNYDIDRINQKYKCFKKDVYVAHYVPVFTDHISRKYFKMAVKTYLEGVKISFIKFNAGLMKYSLIYCKYLLENLFIRRQDKIAG